MRRHLRRTGHDAFTWEDVVGKSLGFTERIMTVMVSNLSALNNQFEGSLPQLEDCAHGFPFSSVCLVADHLDKSGGSSRSSSTHDGRGIFEMMGFSLVSEIIACGVIRVSMSLHEEE